MKGSIRRGDTVGIFACLALLRLYGTSFANGIIPILFIVCGFVEWTRNYHTRHTCRIQGGTSRYMCARFIL